MPENLFSNSAVVWGALLGGLLLLPPLIHLINMLRYRRVKWAAMEFLLKSQRKNKSRIWLKQLLLLVSRMALLAGLLLMLGHLGCRSNPMAALLGSSSTHHYILIDDSLSTSAIDGQGVSAFDRVKKTAQLVLQRTRNRPNQLVSLLRFSKAQYLQVPNGNETPQAPKDPDSLAAEVTSGSSLDFNAVLIDTQSIAKIEKHISEMMPSALAAKPESSIECIRDLMESRPNENSMVYVLSDFRESDWCDGLKLTELFKQVDSRSEQIELIRCERQSLENLVVTDLRPISHVRSVDIPITMSVTVKNTGKISVRNSQLQLSERLLIDSPDPNQTIELPAQTIPTILIDEIPPGGSQTRKFTVNFETAGNHLVRVEGPSDSLPLDNAREAVLKIVPTTKILLVEGATATPSAPFLQLALGASSMTGLQLDSRSPNFLRDTDDDELWRYDAIFLASIGELDEIAVKRLEHFVQAGGGVALFLDEQTNASFYNEYFYRKGQGLFSLPISKAIEIPQRELAQAPDVTVSDRDLFASFTNAKNSPLDLVQIKKMFVPPDTWSESNDESSQVVCSLRGDPMKPLIVTRAWGNGRTALFTTSAAPNWNNWARNPTYVIALMLVEDDLACGRHPIYSPVAGEPWKVQFDTRRFQSRVAFKTPTNNRNAGRTIDIEGMPTQEHFATAVLAIDRTQGEVLTGEPGVYRATLKSKSSADTETRIQVISPDSAESTLAIASPETLVARFGKMGEVMSWDQFNPDPENPAVTPITKALLILVSFLLVLELILAHVNSYHVSRQGAMA